MTSLLLLAGRTVSLVLVPNKVCLFHAIHACFKQNGLFLSKNNETVAVRNYCNTNILKITIACSNHVLVKNKQFVLTLNENKNHAALKKRRNTNIPNIIPASKAYTQMRPRVNIL